MTARSFLGRLRGNRRGSVALEVAMLFPIAVILLVGFAELYFYIRAVAIVERVTQSVAGMLAKRVTLVDCNQTTSSEFLGTHLMAAALTAQPLQLANNGEIIMTAINNPGTGTVVAWQRRSSYTVSGFASAVGRTGAAPTLPTGLSVKTTAGTQADTLVAVETAYRFQPFSGLRQFIPSLPVEVTIQRRAFARGRWGSIGVLGTQAGCSGLPQP